MNKLIALSAVATLACGAFAQGTNAVADTAAPAPVAAANLATTNATAAGTEIREAGTDEIDLEEIDDSAEAAKKATIKHNSKDTQFVDISCDEATLADILRQFRKTTNANIISDDSSNLQQRVSVNLTHVDWLRGLDAILNMKNFRIEERQGIYRVVEDQQKIPVFTRTFQLNHASSQELADLFNKSYGVKLANGKTSEVATAFPSANTVVISATEKQLAECEAIIKAVDKAVAQIYIEARFMELSSSAMHQLGLQWDSLQKVGATTKDVAISATKDAETLTHGPWNDTFTGTLTASDFGLYLSAFEKVGGTQIFSNPKVIVSNGKEAHVDMTTKFPNIRITSQRGQSTTSGSGTYIDYTAQLEQIQGDKPNPKENIQGGLFAGSCFYSWGITLSVKPRISDDGLISVEIIPSISQLDTDTTDDGFYSVSSASASSDDNQTAYGKYPIISVKSITTEFSMHDGSTAVIGGLTRTTEEDVDSGIPYLREIPWIGQYLFGWKSRQKVQKEIIICVTLGIANPANLPEDVGLPTNAVYGREYVNGERLEPGLREQPADQVMSLDTGTFEEIRPQFTIEKGAQSRGTVIITPSAE